MHIYVFIYIYSYLFVYVCNKGCKKVNRLWLLYLVTGSGMSCGGQGFPSGNVTVGPAAALTLLSFTTLLKK